MRRPSVLAAVAAALLAISLVVLVARSGSESDAPADPAGDRVADPGAEDPGTAQDDAGDGDGAAEDGDGQATQDGQEGDGAGGDQPDDGGGAGDDAAAEEGEGSADRAALEPPAAGAYGYVSGGTWSLRGAGEPQEYQLPDTATGTVQVDGDTWQLRLAAGDRYADRFGFVVAADDGLDWTSWVLERQFRDGPSETSYSCSGDAAYYRPGEQGRVVDHDCASEAGIVSDGRVEHVGREEVTLGDGTVVSADRIVHTYTLSASDSASFEVSGEGRLELWLDPATGMRLREQRSISSTTTQADGRESVYEEAVEFTLQSQQPS